MSIPDDDLISNGSFTLVDCKRIDYNRSNSSTQPVDRTSIAHPQAQFADAAGGVEREPTLPDLPQVKSDSLEESPLQKAQAESNAEALVEDCGRLIVKHCSNVMGESSKVNGEFKNVPKDIKRQHAGFQHNSDPQMASVRLSSPVYKDQDKSCSQV